jgi:hypothetical protein
VLGILFDWMNVPIFRGVTQAVESTSRHWLAGILIRVEVKACGA